MNSFTKEAWDKASKETKNELLYGAIININSDVQKLHKWKFFNTAITGISSFAGGMMAVWMWIRFIVPV